MSLVTRDAVRAAARTWVMAAVPDLTDAVYPEQAAPRPGTPYATVKITGVQAEGQEHRYGWGADPGAPDYVPRLMAGDRTATLSVQFFGAGALDYARTAAQALGKRSVQDALAAAGVGVQGVPDVQDLTALLDTSFEERALIEPVFVWGDTYTDDTPVAETFTGTATITGPGGAAHDTIDYDTSQGA